MKHPSESQYYSKQLFLTARFTGPTWGPTGTDRTQVDPMLAPSTLLSGYELLTCCCCPSLISWCAASQMASTISSGVKICMVDWYSPSCQLAADRQILTGVWLLHHLRTHVLQWASCQIRKIAGAHAPGMPGTFSPSPRVSNPDMHHDTCVTHVPWCMPGSLTSSFLWNRRWGKTFPAFPAHAQPAILRIW